MFNHQTDSNKFDYHSKDLDTKFIFKVGPMLGRGRFNNTTVLLPKKIGRKSDATSLIPDVHCYEKLY